MEGGDDHEMGEANGVIMGSVMGSGMSIDLFVHLLVGSGYGTKKL